MPEPGPNEVLVKVEAVGICAGDAKTYAGATRFWGQLVFCVTPMILIKDPYKGPIYLTLLLLQIRH